MRCAAKNRHTVLEIVAATLPEKYLQRDSTADYSTRTRFCQRLFFCLFFGIFFAVAKLFFASVRAADGCILQNIGEICAKSLNILSMKRCPLRGFFLGQSAIALFLRKGIDSINFMLFHKFFFRNFPGSSLRGRIQKPTYFSQTFTGYSILSQQSFFVNHSLCFR